jgi:succinate dehydrogenase / fumarate reductase cytochrome b subunit
LNNWLVRALSTTVGQKILMGATGLLLCGFLVAHLAGNLLMYQGAEHYDRYAAALHSNELLPLAEAGLLVLFVLHILLAFATTRENAAARPIGYAVKESKLPAGDGLRPHRVMMWTGLVVLGFLVLHLIDMRFAHFSSAAVAWWNGEPVIASSRFYIPEGETPFGHALRVLQDPLSMGVYLIGSLFLGYHVAHGFQSAFRSLGFSHPKYTPFLETLSNIFALVVAIGFASLPLMVWFGWLTATR